MLGVMVLNTRTGFDADEDRMVKPETRHQNRKPGIFDVVALHRVET